MAYADCFAVALTRLKKGELNTKNPEFRVVEKEIRLCGFNQSRRYEYAFTPKQLGLITS